MSNPSNHMEAFDDESVWKVDILAPDAIPTYNVHGINPQKYFLQW